MNWSKLLVLFFVVVQIVVMTHLIDNAEHAACDDFAKGLWVYLVGAVFFIVDLVILTIALIRWLR